MASQYDLPYTGNQVETLLGKVTELEDNMPTKTSDLTNDAGFITAADVPTKTSDLTNDSGFITNAEVVAETGRAQAAEQVLSNRIDDINAKIPSAASSSNQLADKAFVNSSVGTSTANYISDNGEPFTSLEALQAYTGPHDNNDYAFVVSTDAAGNTVYSRYKYNESTGVWGKEYDLNNSSFTAAQWNAINSLMTAAKTQKLDALPTAAQLTQLFAGKQDVIADLATIRAQAAAAYVKPQAGIPKTDLESAVQTSLNKADSAVQDVSNKADKDANAVEGNVAKFDANGNPVDGGMAVANLAQKDGAYDSMSVGSAKRLEGQNAVVGAFMERTTGGDAEVANGLAQIMEVRGNSQRWNQILPNGNFVDTTKWQHSDVNFSVANGEATISATADTNTAKLLYQTAAALKLVNGRKYYAAVLGKTSDSSYGAYLSYRESSNVSIAGNSANTSYYKHKAIVFTHNGDGTRRLVLALRNITPTTVTVNFKNVILLDLTAIGIDNLTTVAEVEAWLAENIGLRDYSPYNEGEVLNNKMTGLESIGRNLLDPATGKARILGAYSDVYGNYYGITGTHGTLTFTSDLGDTSEVTPDSDGKFLLETPGWLDVATPGNDCAVFLWWDGTKTDYVEYDREVANLDVTHIYGKLNGTGELVQVFPGGMAGVNDVKDILRNEDGVTVARKRIGVRAYASGDGSDATVITDGRTLTYYVLATEQVFTDLVYQGSSLYPDGTPVTLPMPLMIDNWGIERVLPQNPAEGPVTSAPELAIKYSIDVQEQLDTIRTSGIFAEDLKANIQALLTVVNAHLSETMGGTIAIGGTPTDKVYPFSFIPDEPTPDTTE